MRVRRLSIAEIAYRELRKAILHGRFSPGTRLVVRPLTEELGLSPTPVKTALAALEKEGLIRVVPNRGYFVEAFDVQAVNDICAVRGAMDRLAAELTASRPDHAAVAVRLKRNLAAQRIAIKEEEMMRYADLNHDFHLKISQASGSQRVAKISDSIAGQVRLLVNSSARVPGRPGQSLEEHAAIVEAIATGDSLSAGTYALAHALNSEETLLDLLNSSSAEAKH